ncbi:MAG: metallophosphoesterase family protein [Endomicrobiia bacterium]
MKYAIISDVHSNYNALICCIEKLKEENVDKIFCCGDIVGYCAEPNECIEVFKKEKIFSVLGNHDAALLDILELDFFNHDAKEAIIINKSLITQENIEFLKSIKQKEVFEDILFVHGSIEDPLIEYLDNIYLLRRNIKFLKQNLCFCGHTHRPFVYSYDLNNQKEDLKIPNTKIFKFEIENNKRYIINVGAVGQPRDGDNRACVVVYDKENSVVEFKRIKYNVFYSQQKMVELKIPEFLIKRLEFGE